MHPTDFSDDVIEAISLKTLLSFCGTGPICPIAACSNSIGESKNKSLYETNKRLQYYVKLN